MMARLSVTMERFDIHSEIENENVLVSKVPSSKMGILRTPLTERKNKLEGTKLSDTPQRKSAMRNSQQDLQMLNAQLQTSIKIQQEEIRSFEVQSAKDRAKIAAMEKTITNLEYKCRGMEKSLQNPDSYYDHYKKAHQLVLELHSEKREFEGLMSDIESTTKLQFRMKNALTGAAKKLLTLSKDDTVIQKLRKEIALLQGQCAKCQEELAESEREKRQMGGDISLMQGLLMQSNNSMSELDEKWHCLHQDIKQSQDRIRQLESENASVTKAFNVMMREKIKAEEELSQCKGKTDKMKSDHDDTRTKMELYIENLQHTLDSWEVDREIAEEEITNLRQEVLSQQTSIKEMATELVELRKKQEERVNVQSELEKLKSNSAVLEAEKDFYTSAITDYRMKLEAEVELTKSNQSLITALKSSNDELQCSFEQLQMDFDNLQEELSMAHDRSSVLGAIVEQVHMWVGQALASLQQSFGVKLSLTPKCSKRQATGQSFVGEVLSIANKWDSARKGLPQGKDASFLNAPSSSVKKLVRALRQDNVEYGSARKIKPLVRHQQQQQQQELPEGDNPVKVTSRKCLSFGQSESSDKNPSNIHPSAVSDDAMKLLETREDRATLPQELELGAYADDKLVSSPGFAVVRHIPSTTVTVAGLEMAAGSSMKSADGSCDLVEQCETMMDSIEDMLTLIARTGLVMDKASKLSMRDLKEEIDILQDSLMVKAERIRELEREVEAKTEDSQRLKGEMEGLNQRVGAMTRAILAHEDRGYDLKRLEEEKEDWRLREKRLTGEISLLTEQLQEVVSQADSEHGQTMEGACLGKIVALKKKNYQLQCQIHEEIERSKQMSSKLSRRLRVTESNWEKAESEAKELDDIVQSIRKICIDTRMTCQSPSLLHIIRLIDGISDVTETSIS